MNTREVEQYLIDVQKKVASVIFERSLTTSSGKKINVILGPRRAGKTSYLYQRMQEHIKQGKNKEELLFLNFENTSLFDLHFKEIREVIELHKKLFSPRKKPVLFLDEPQNIRNWEIAIRELHDSDYQIFISGSSSKLLSKEIATSLRGRSLSYLLLPFSFKEFLQVRGFKVSKFVSTEEKTDILRQLGEYLESGGFPEVVLEPEMDTKIKILESYLDMVIYKDIVERHGVRDSLLVKWLIKSIASSYTKEISIHKIYLTLKSQGRKISKDELYIYASLLNDSFFALYLPKFSWSLRKREPVNKVFLCDVGFARMVEVGKDIGKKMENILYLELLRRKKPTNELYFWKNAQQEEVDFVIKEGRKITRLIQVVEKIADTDVKEREIRALLKASKELKCDDLIIITENYEDKKEESRKDIRRKISYIPLWKFLLSEES